MLLCSSVLPLSLNVDARAWVSHPCGVVVSTNVETCGFTS